MSAGSTRRRPAGRRRSAIAQTVLGEADWQGAVAVAMGGDGSTATAGFWAALNMAGTLALPMLFLIEDNGYAISVPSTLQFPGGDIMANLASYQGILLLDGDGAEPIEAARADRAGARACARGRRAGAAAAAGAAPQRPLLGR